MYIYIYVYGGSAGDDAGGIHHAHPTAGADRGLAPSIYNHRFRMRERPPL